MPTATRGPTRTDVVAGCRFVTHAARLRALLAFAVILSVVGAAAAPIGSAGGTAQICGLSIAIQDPDIRASFVRFARNQSTSAAKACAGARNAVAVAQATR